MGLLVDGFDSSPTFMMTYNPPYYARLLRELRLPQGPGPVRLLGPHLHAAEGRARSWRRSCEQIIERYNVRMRPLDTSRFLEEVKIVPVDLQPLADQHLGIRAHVASARWSTSPGLAVPDGAGVGRGRGGGRPDGRRDLRPAGLQPADPRDRRPAVPLRLHPPAAQQARRSSGSG